MICVTMFITGGLDGGLGYRAEVLAWLDEEQQWVEEGKMPMARGTMPSPPLTTRPLPPSVAEFDGCTMAWSSKM